MRVQNYSVRIVGGTEKQDGYVSIPHGRQFEISVRNDNQTWCKMILVIGGKNVGEWILAAGQQAKLERPLEDTGRFTFYQVGTVEAGKAGIVAGDMMNGLVQVTFVPERYVRQQPRPVVEHHHHYHEDHYIPYPVYPPYPWHPWTYRPPIIWGSGGGGLSQSSGTWAGETDCLRSRTADAPVPGEMTYTVTNTATGGLSSETISNTMAEGNLMADASAGVATTKSEFKEGSVGLSGQSDQTWGSAYLNELDESRSVTISLRLVSGPAVEEPRPLIGRGNAVPPPLK